MQHEQMAFFSKPNLAPSDGDVHYDGPRMRESWVVLCVDEWWLIYIVPRDTPIKHLQRAKKRPLVAKQGQKHSKGGFTEARTQDLIRT